MLQKEKYMDTEKKCMMKKFRITSFHVCEIWRSKSATCILAEFLKKKIVHLEEENSVYLSISLQWLFISVSI